MEVYARIRRAVQVDGMSIREAAREFGLSRKTIRKMLQFSLPPGYQRKKPVGRPKLGPWLGFIDQILVEDQSRPKKQRHTAKRIFDRLKAEHAFSGGYTIVKDYVRQARLTHKESLWYRDLGNADFYKTACQQIVRGRLSGDRNLWCGFGNRRRRFPARERRRFYTQSECFQRVRN